MTDNPIFDIVEIVAPTEDYCGHVDKMYDLKDGDIIRHPFHDKLVIYGPCKVRLLQRRDGTAELRLCKDWTFEIEVDDDNHTPEYYTHTG